MRGDKKGIRKKVGDFYKIPLGDGSFAYGQVITSVDHAFFDFKDNGKSLKPADIVNKSVIFRCTVDRYVIAKGYWEIIGNLPVSKEHLIDQDLFSYNDGYYIFKDGIGDVPATWEEVQNMEPFASWGYMHIEQRLRDHFAGRPCYTIESSRNDHYHNFPKKEEFYKLYGCVLVDEENWVYAPPGTKVTYD